MRKSRVIGFVAAAIVTVGLTSGVASATGTPWSGDAKPAKPSGSTSAENKGGTLHGGMAIQRTKDGFEVRKLTEEELGDMDGAKPTKPLPENGTTTEDKPGK
ncbi:hypothetical protein [Streptomyces mayonensis]|uniref:hypothetical protein n=1 Tax=Streptomyces mayonensis TaxID=2750816 RepID=UPI001C1E5104|nr:hypothetical protein [Streptomyces sp. A108]MBU6532166.1 hypothetical protein [Streptomyces sp. A108]